MNRRTFLQLLVVGATAPLWYRSCVQVGGFDRAAGQFVFDGVNGLTFPATPAALPAPARHRPNATQITRFRAWTFLEKLLEGHK